MEESNTVGLTFKQRVDAANATGWTNQPKPYNDSKIKLTLETNADAVASVCIVMAIVFGFCFILRSIKN